MLKTERLILAAAILITAGIGAGVGVIAWLAIADWPLVVAVTTALYVVAAVTSYRLNT